MRWATGGRLRWSKKCLDQVLVGCRKSGNLPPPRPMPCLPHRNPNPTPLPPALHQARRSIPSQLAYLEAPIQILVSSHHPFLALDLLHDKPASLCPRWPREGRAPNPCISRPAIRWWSRARGGFDGVVVRTLHRWTLDPTLSTIPPRSSLQFSPLFLSASFCDLRSTNLPGTRGATDLVRCFARPTVPRRDPTVTKEVESRLLPRLPAQEWTTELASLARTCPCRILGHRPANDSLPEAPSLQARHTTSRVLRVYSLSNSWLAGSRRGHRSALPRRASCHGRLKTTRATVNN